MSHKLRHSARAIDVIVYTDTREKVEVTPFSPSDMIDARSFCDSQSSEVARPKKPILKGSLNLLSPCII